jgi:hypothetical protein
VKCGLKGLYECFGTNEGWRIATGCTRAETASGTFTVEWRDKTKQFVENAFPDPSKPAKIFCPYKKCCNKKR